MLLLFWFYLVLITPPPNMPPQVLWLSLFSTRWSDYPSVKLTSNMRHETVKKLFITYLPVFEIGVPVKSLLSRIHLPADGISERHSHQGSFSRAIFCWTALTVTTWMNECLPHHGKWTGFYRPTTDISEVEISGIRYIRFLYATQKLKNHCGRPKTRKYRAD